jgi:hypothetical protein
MKEIRKKMKKKESEPTGPIPAQQAQHPRRPVRQILSAARPRSASAREPDFPRFFFILFDFSEPISTQTRISQDLQLIFRIRLFLHIPNSSTDLSLYIWPPPPYIYVSFLEIPKSSLPKL